MSESSLSDNGPDDTILEQELRQVVGRIFKSGNLEELTVNGVRNAAQDSLGLRKGFFKEADWKERSKTVIENEVTKHNNPSSSQQVSPAKPSPKPPKAAARPAKRSSPDEPEPKKRRKLTNARTSKAKATVVSEDSDEDVPSPEEKKRKLTNARTSKAKATVVSEDSEEDIPSPQEKKSKDEPSAGDSSSLSDVEGDGSVPEDVEKEPKAPQINVADAIESELSDVIDDGPKPKRRKKGSREAKPKKAPKKEPKKRGRKSAPKEDLDPDTEEIKRLQWWLVKCGMRKMWAKELKPFDTPSEKIRHLKEMLSDAGMTGRFSTEKAARIREARELQADLAAVTEGAKRWGKVDEEEEEVKPRPARSTGLPNFDFLESESE